MKILSIHFIGINTFYHILKEGHLFFIRGLIRNFSKFCYLYILSHFCFDGILNFARFYHIFRNNPSISYSLCFELFFRILWKKILRRLIRILSFFLNEFNQFLGSFPSKTWPLSRCRCFFHELNTFKYINNIVKPPYFSLTRIWIKRVLKNHICSFL